MGGGEGWDGGVNDKVFWKKTVLRYYRILHNDFKIDKHEEVGVGGGIWLNSGVNGRVMAGNMDKIYTKVGPYNKPFN